MALFKSDLFRNFAAGFAIGAGALLVSTGGFGAAAHNLVAVIL